MSLARVGGNCLRKIRDFDLNFGTNGEHYIIYLSIIQFE